MKCQSSRSWVTTLALGMGCVFGAGFLYWQSPLIKQDVTQPDTLPVESHASDDPNLKRNNELRVEIRRYESEIQIQNQRLAQAAELAANPVPYQFRNPEVRTYLEKGAARVMRPLYEELIHAWNFSEADTDQFLRLLNRSADEDLRLMLGPERYQELEHYRSDLPVQKTMLELQSRFAATDAVLRPDQSTALRTLLKESRADAADRSRYPNDSAVVVSPERLDAAATFLSPSQMRILRWVSERQDRSNRAEAYRAARLDEPTR